MAAKNQPFAAIKCDVLYLIFLVEIHILPINTTTKSKAKISSNNE